MLELCLIHIVLVLSYADTLRIDLYQLCQGIHQSAAYRDSSTHGDILVRELFSGNLRGRIDGCAILADGKDLWLRQFVFLPGIDIITTSQDVFDEIIGLTTGGAVADGDGLNLILLNHLLNSDGRLSPFVNGRMGEYGIMMEQIALCIETDNFAAGSEAGVDAHDTLLAQGSTKEQLAQVLGKHTDGFFVSPFFAQSSELRLDGRFQQTFIAIVDCFADQLSARCVTIDVVALQFVCSLFIIR